MVGCRIGAACLVVVACSTAQATQYTFTKIATRADGYSEFLGSGFQTISDSGDVLFYSALRYFVGNGHTTTEIPFPRGGGGSIYPASINASGQAAGTTSRIAGQQTLTRITSGDVLVLDLKPEFDLYQPDINESGQVAYFRNIDPGLQQLVVTDGTTTSIIADNVRFANLPFSFLTFPDLNNSGRVAFAATGGIYVGNGSETEAADYTKISSFGSRPVINDTGVVAFWHKQSSVTTIYYGNGAELLTHADTIGPFAALDDVAINNDGTIAFKGALDTGVEGIYTGPDPIADKIITSGDELFGSTVSALRFGQRGLNNHGEIAFWALLLDGTEGIFKASPVVFNPADLNQDGKVDIFDVAIVSNHWSESGPQGDANLDGAVDIFDVAAISNNWSPDGAWAVPEPASAAITMVLFGLCVVQAVIRRK